VRISNFKYAIMKKIILILSILSIVNYSMAQQAVTLDAKSISTPKYADLTTIEAAITLPQAGMMVYNIALNQHMYYNGSGWTIQSAASSLWQQNGETISFGVGTSVYSATPNAGIPDGGQVSDIINVSRTGTVAQASDVTVFFVLNHTYSGDVKVTLKSPNGTEIELFSYSFGGINDFSNPNTISFNSLAASTIPLTNPFPTGTYLPTGSGAGDLNTLTGLTITGDWTLIIADVDPFADNGIFVSWGISFNDPSKVGIGTTMPVARLDVAGNIKITDGTQGVNKVLTSDANGLASWLAPANGQTNGTLAGQMQYWNGSAWVTIAPGSTGQVLTYTINGPEWSAGENVANLPSVATTSISSITGVSASSGGNILGDGGIPITEKGVCWSTSTNPTIAGPHSSNGTGTGAFVSNLTGLSLGSFYYVRAFATNNAGTSYGAELSFTADAALPTITNTSISSITETTASGGGNVSADGGANITARGICWSTSPLPTIANSLTTDGTGLGSFTSEITGLVGLTTYYVRAYATNVAGTSYGTQLSFVTVIDIGSLYQGGKVAYIYQSGDPGYVLNETHGLIAAASDQSTGIQWYNGSNVETGATAPALGTGNANTNTIVSVQGTGSYAAKLCADLVLNTYGDWFLPSLDELNKLYINRGAIGGFTTKYYWTSTEWSVSAALGQLFNDPSNGAQGTFIKSADIFPVRAVRVF
jgi:subtilisin-like proprotein convertase family protein